eukprot:6166958-Lingulodinium_polyedra.AAC.1
MVEEGELKKTLDNGSFVLEADQLEKELDIVGQSFWQVEATGVTKDQLEDDKNSSGLSRQLKSELLEAVPAFAKASAQQCDFSDLRIIVLATSALIEQVHTAHAK